MKIEKAKETQDGVIEAEVDGVKMFIPKDPANRHYSELMDKKVRVAPADPVSAPTPAALFTVDDLLEALISEGVIKGVATVGAFKAKHMKAAKK